MTVGPRSRLAASTAAGLLAVCLASCTSELDDAIARGCNGLRVMSESYLTGDRDTFDAALLEGRSFGAAVELASDDGSDPTPDSLIVLGHDAVRVYSIAAYEAPEANGGDLIWQGSDLNAEGRATVDQALSACDAR